MMKTIQVASINTRDVVTKFGQKKVYDLIDTTGEKFGFGFVDPATRGITVSSFVTGDIVTDKYGSKFADPKSAAGSMTGAVSAPTAAATSGSAVATESRSYGYKEKVFPVPMQHGDMAIIRQNALSNATAMVSDFVATLSSEEFPDRDTWSDWIIETAYKFAKFSSGAREVEAAKKMATSGVATGADISKALESQIGEG